MLFQHVRINYDKEKLQHYQIFINVFTLMIIRMVAGFFLAVDGSISEQFMTLIINSEQTKPAGGVPGQTGWIHQ